MKIDGVMIVIFGRPGAGKSTTAEASIRLLSGNNNNTTTTWSNHDDDVQYGIVTQNITSKVHHDRNYYYLYLDLDVCVPQWMRDNFAKGIYPTLQQRQDFISTACEYVTNQIMKVNSCNANERNDNDKDCSKVGEINGQQILITVVSFSFVNTDLRDAFRSHFPHAEWVLVDTRKELAQERILAREGHFYKGEANRSNAQDSITEEGVKRSEGSSRNNNDDNNVKSSEENAVSNDYGDVNNSEWEFRPVDFPHTILSGCNSVEDNAMQVVDCINKILTRRERK